VSKIIILFLSLIIILRSKNNKFLDVHNTIKKIIYQIFIVLVCLKWFLVL
jgi:hypothetical protein